MSRRRPKLVHLALDPYDYPGRRGDRTLTACGPRAKVFSTFDSPLVTCPRCSALLAREVSWVLTHPRRHCRHVDPRDPDSTLWLPLPPWRYWCVACRRLVIVTFLHPSIATTP